MNAVPSYREIRAVAVAAEEGGLDSVWVYDHLLFRFDGETTGIHECWTILAAIAEATSRVQLGTIVMCTSFRNAALLAKMAAHARSPQRRPADPGHRLRLARPRVRGVRLSDRSQGRAVRGVAHDHPLADPRRPGRSRRTLDDGQGRGARPAGAPRPADPHRGETATDARADRSPRRRLEHRLVRGAGRALARCPGRSRGGLRRRRSRSGDPRADGRRQRASTRTWSRPPARPAHTDIDDDDGREAAAAASPDERVEPALRGDDEIAAGLAAYADEGTGHLIAALEPTTPEAVARLAATRAGGSLRIAGGVASERVGLARRRPDVRSVLYGRTSTYLPAEQARQAAEAGCSSGAARTGGPASRR